MGFLRGGLLLVETAVWFWFVGLSVLLPVWVIGCVALVALPGALRRLHGAPLVLSRALWFNVGAVCLALLVPGPTRMIMLVVPLFSVVYAAIYLMRGQVLAGMEQNGIKVDRTVLARLSGEFAGAMGQLETDIHTRRIPFDPLRASRGEFYAFFLLSLIGYLRFIQTKNRVNYALVLAFCVLSLFVVLPPCR